MNSIPENNNGFVSRLSSCSPAESDDMDLDGITVCEGDCDDANEAVFPGAAQVCGDGRNNDCSHIHWPTLVGTKEGDDDMDGSEECGGDCDDTRASVYPGAPQVCGDGLNNDCNDPDWPLSVQVGDADQDGDGYRICEGDCDDSRSAIRPGMPQICDGFNNDCSAPSWPSIVGTNEFDNDGDGYPTCQGDCDDANSLVAPASAEVCNGIDENCNGLVDEDLLGGRLGW